ncbi:protein of unknown function [Cyanobium sp. NIES-981]|nr:protein of unknown function [Cyanobium sp. NIES-981]
MADAIPAMGEAAAAAGAAGGTGVLVIAVVVVGVGIGLWLIFKHYCRLTVTPSTPVVVAQYATATVIVTLERKSWVGGSWTAVVPANYSATSTGKAQAALAGSPTNATTSSATLTLTGGYKGQDSIKITASGSDCSLGGTLPVTIT